MAVNIDYLDYQDLLCPKPPCWLTKLQQKQAIALQRIGFTLCENDDFFDEPDFENAEKVEDWEFVSQFPRKPDEFNDYPNGNDYEILARCGTTIFYYYATSEAQDYEQALDEYEDILSDFECVKLQIKDISQKYSAHIDQLCLV